MFAFWSRCGPICPTAHASIGVSPLWSRRAWCTWEVARCRVCWTKRAASLKKVCSYVCPCLHALRHTRTHTGETWHPSTYQTSYTRSSPPTGSQERVRLALSWRQLWWPVYINVPLTWGWHHHQRALGPGAVLFFGFNWNTALAPSAWISPLEPNTLVLWNTAMCHILNTVFLEQGTGSNIAFWDGKQIWAEYDILICKLLGANFHGMNPLRWYSKLRSFPEK